LLELALNRAVTRTDGSDQLALVERLVGVAIEQRKQGAAGFAE
jgi:hypothetical protein